jgi:holin-like protein
MLKGMAMLMMFQLTGELFAATLGLPVSGPLIGMALLLVWLHGSGGIDNDLASAADGLLANMAVLFVPVGVGVIAYAEVFRQHWLFVAVAIVFGAAATIAATAATARLLVRIRVARVARQP